MKRRLAIVLVAVVTFGAIVRVLGGGWALLFGGGVVAGVAVLLHMLLHFRALKQCDDFDGPTLKMVITSHVLFVAAFLLTYDYDDADGGLVVQRVFGAGGFPSEEGLGMLWGILVFIPVCISWIVLLWKLEDL